MNALVVDDVIESKRFKGMIVSMTLVPLPVLASRVGLEVGQAEVQYSRCEAQQKSIRRLRSIVRRRAEAILLHSTRKIGRVDPLYVVIQGGAKYFGIRKKIGKCYKETLDRNSKLL